MRKKNDLYQTSAKAVKELLDRVPISGTLFECCAGMGAISYALRDEIPEAKIITNDINVTLPATNHFDASKASNWEQFTRKDLAIPMIDWVITNPPFNKAFPILMHAHNASLKGVAFLLRLSFLEPTYERQDWLYEHPPSKLIVLPRYSFTEDGKIDSVTCAWMIWSKTRRWEDTSIMIARKQER